MKNSYRTHNYNVKEKKKKLTKEEKKQRKAELKLDNKDKICLNQIIKPIVYFVLCFALEMVNYFILNMQTASGARQLLPTYIMFDIGIWLFVAGLIFISSKNWLSNTIFYFFIILQIVLCAVNATLHSDFGYFFTWDMIVLAIEAIDSFDISFVDLKTAIMYLALIVVFVSIPLIIDACAKRKKFLVRKVTKPIFMLIAFFVAFCLGTSFYGVQIATLKKSDKKVAALESDLYLYQNMHMTEEALRKFGTWGFYTKNLYDLSLGRIFVAGKEDTIGKIKAEEVATNTDATMYGDNLIVIMMESYEWFAIDPYNTPNLWKLKTGELYTGKTSSVPSMGTVINSYHANNKTNVSEDVALLGYMPYINQFALTSEDAYSVAYSLPNLFKQEGYSTAFFHNFLPNFYDRTKVNIGMGFDEFYNVDDFQSSNKGWDFQDFNLEADFVEQMKDKIAPTDKKFMSFYTTVSSHGSYEVGNPRFAQYYSTYDANYQDFSIWMNNNGYNCPTDEYWNRVLRQYKCATMDTDAAIGVLFKHLTETGLINNTTVLVYSDHNAYYHGLTNKIKGTATDDLGNLTTHNVPMLFYSSKLGSQKIDSFCNTYDIYPTICELFGLNYSKFFCQGYNIFSEEIKDSFYVSFLTGYYNSKCYSKNLKNISLYEGSTKADIETFKINYCKFYEKQRLIEKVYRAGWKVN